MSANKIWFAMAIMMAGAAVHAATVTIAPTISYMYQQDGTTKLQGNQLYLLVADTNGNGFGAAGDGTIGQNFVLGADDKVLRAWASPSSPAPLIGQCKPNATGLTLDGVPGATDGLLSTGDAFAIYFFQDVTLADYQAGLLSGGAWYGFYTKASFVVPSAGGSFTEAVPNQTNIVNLRVVGGGPLTYTLSVASSGVTGVAITSATGHGGTTGYSLNGLVDGTSVELTAAAVPGYLFMGWTGAVTSTGVTISLTMDNNKTVTANYVRLTYTLTVTSNGAAGVAITSATGHGGTTHYSRNDLTDGVSVELTAPAVPGHTFTGWSGAVTSVGATITLTMNGNLAVAANYAPATYTLSVTSSGVAGIAITSATGHGGTTDYNRSGLAYGTSVELTAPAVPGYIFTGWTGAVTAANATLNLTLEDDRAVTANYAPRVPIEVHTLADLQKIGSGTDGWTLDASYILMNDLDAAATAGWNGRAGFAPIKPFSGVFDGNRQTIYNLTVNRPDEDGIGLFGIVSGGIIKEVGLVGGGITGRNGVGGLVGEANHATLTRCYARIAVTGTADVGGLAGRVGAPALLTQCYAAGAVTGTATVGGLAGLATGVPTTTACYWDRETTGQAASAGGEAKTTAQMKQQTTFAGWDFTLAWGIEENTSYPFLQDRVPDAFSFADVTGAALDTVVGSNAITVSGINEPAAITVTGGDYQIGANGWTHLNGTVANGEQVTLRQTSSSDRSATTECVLTIGGVTDVWSVTTVTKQAQTIAFPALPEVRFGAADFAPGATASSGLPVTCESSNHAVATIVAGQIHIVGAGAATITATQPGDALTEAAAPMTRVLTVGKALSVLTWNHPTEITYGTALSVTQLNATANVPGTWVYTPAAGTVPGAGNRPLQVAFTPADPANYSAATAEVMLTVNPAILTVAAKNQTRPYSIANPALTWTVSGFVNGDTAAVLAGTPALATTALMASPVGTYPITAAAGTLAAANYIFNFVNATLTIGKASPVVAWPTPSAITYGTALSATQLNATTAVPGIWAYTPAAGAVPGTGPRTLHAAFTPIDPVNYSAASADVTLTVNKALLTITADNQTRPYGAANPVLTWTSSGFVNGDTAAVFAGAPALATPAIATSPVGAYPITVTSGTLTAANYSFRFVNGTLTVPGATPVITWATPKAITYGTALSATQLNAKANVPGTWVYNPALGAKLAAGTRTLTTTFTPVATATYGTVSQSVALVVNKAAATVTLGSLAQACNGTPRPVTATTKPAGLKVSFVYNGSPIPPVTAGSYAVIGTVDEVNYQGSKSGTLVIKTVPPTVSRVKLLSLTGAAAVLDITCAAGVTDYFIQDGSGTLPVNPSWQNAVVVTADSAKTVFHARFGLPAVTGRHTLYFWARNAGTGGISSTATRLNVTLAGPAISGFAPANGVAPGGIITINGTHFGDISGGVTFTSTVSGTVFGDVVAWNATRIRCLVPESLAGQANTGVTVTSSDGLSGGQKTLPLLKFYVGVWSGVYEDILGSSVFIARISALASSTADRETFMMRLNNRPFACVVTSSRANPASMAFTGTATAPPEAACSGTITGNSIEFTVADGVYQGERPQGATFGFGNYYLLKEAANTSYGAVYQFTDGKALKIKDLSTQKTMGYQDLVDDILLFGAAGLPAQMEWQVTSAAADGQAQTLTGRQTQYGTGRVLAMTGKLLVPHTGLADLIDVPWACTTTENGPFPTLKITLKGNTIKISGWFNDGSPGFAPFTVTGKIYREYDSTRCPFTVTGTGRYVREMHGFIDDFRIQGVAEMSNGFGGWVDVNFTGARPD